LLLGNNVHFDESIPVRLTKEQRLRHTHIIGATGTGKSTLLFNLIRQDIENGEGVGVLDPSGDLIERILGIIPESRIKDVILVNPYDTDYPIAFNILQAQNEDEKNILASDLVSMFRRFSELGVQMDVVLRNAILAIMNSSTGGTLADLHNFLIDDDDFRKRFLTTVKDESVLNFWQKVFPRLPGGKSIGSVLIRLHTFLDQKPFRLMVTQRENRLNFADIMDSGKIFLAKLPEGLMGAEDSYLLGTLLVSKFQQTAMARQARAESDRPDFWLYIDEFDNFITPSMAMILSKTRKYHLGLTLAHHNLHQLQADAKVASAVMTNPATRIVFKVGGDDAKKLAEGFTSFEAQDFRNLEKGQAICSVERSDFDFNLSIPLPGEINKEEAAERREKIIAASRARYGTPRAKEEDSSVSTPAPVVPHVSEKPMSSEIPKPAMESVAMPEPTLPVTETESVAEEADTDLENEQHTNIKNEIRDEAETLDYTATCEVNFPEVHGRADIVMERGSKKIIGQVTVTTPAKYEVESILKAGLTHIAVISINRKKLNLIQQIFEKGGGKTDIVGYYSPSEFITQLYNWASVDPAGGAIESVKPQRRQEPQNSSQLSREQLEQRHKEALEKLRKKMRCEAVD
jgi:DNA segregation ATPase FtsK/SpoIIIE-like protein